MSSSAFTSQRVCSCQGGKTRQRQRKIINLAFSHSQLQKLRLRFQDSSAKFVGMIRDSLVAGVTVFNVLDWTVKAAMDIIGRAVFQYDFCSLEGKKTELGTALRHIW
ncbi:hypothetical protein DFS33DRAFT_1289860 [Desarmillaria ectypa]|nr:hypothetical protein DFS33DRAFT_1289860 [Desarmillaria ectypa]